MRGSCRARTWTVRLTDKDTNHYAIPPPGGVVEHRSKDTFYCSVEKVQIARNGWRISDLFRNKQASRGIHDENLVN